MFGPGTGALLAAAQVAMFDFGLTNAVADTKLLNLLSNSAGLHVLMSQRHVLWMLDLAMAAASILGGQIAAVLALQYGSRVVRPLLVAVCFGLVDRLVWNSGLIPGIIA